MAIAGCFDELMLVIQSNQGEMDEKDKFRTLYLCDSAESLPKTYNSGCLCGVMVSVAAIMNFGFYQLLI
jgi:hypothetical protein